jgi:hypothetical protein
MQRKIVGLKKDKVTGGRMKLHKKELYDQRSAAIFFSGDKIKNNEMGVACSTIGEGERCA